MRRRYGVTPVNVNARAIAYGLGAWIVWMVIGAFHGPPWARQRGDPFQPQPGGTSVGITSWTVTSATMPLNSTRSVSPRLPIGVPSADAGGATTPATAASRATRSTKQRRTHA